MSLSPEIRDQAYQFFIEEATELLHTIEMGLLELRNERSTAKIHEVMRAAHSIKGGAASVELEAIKTISHRLESIFKALYSDSVILTPELETALLEGYDCLRLPLEEQISTGHLDEEAALAQAEPALEKLEGILGEALQESEGYVPSSEELGVDIVASIFEVDVVQGLDRLAEVHRNPANYPVAGELRAQLEVFSGLAEILNLPGFGTLTATAMEALQRHPQRADDILALALADFEIAKEKVLQGDRKEGGSPSADLVALAQAEVETDLPPLALAPTIWDMLPENPSEEFANSGEGPVDIWGDPLLDSMDSVGSDFSVDPPAALDDVFGQVPDGILPLDDVFGGVSVEALDAVFGSGESIWEMTPSDAAAPSTQKPADVLRTPGEKTSTSFDRQAAVELVQANFEQLPALETQPGDLATLLPPPPKSKLNGGLSTESDRSPANLQPLPTSNKSKETQAKTKRTTITRMRSTPGGATIRVPLDRMEQMNNIVGELVISRNSISLQNDQLQGVVRELTDRFSRFQDRLTQLRLIADQMLVEPTRPLGIQSGSYGGGSGYRNSYSNPYSNPYSKTSGSISGNTSGHTSGNTSGNGHAPALTAEWMQTFDVLEMDRYTMLHSQVQEIFEEVLQLEESVGDISLFAGLSNQALNRQRQQLNQLQTELMWARMLPLGDVLNRFPRVIRDLSNKYGKPVQLKLIGTGVLVDKSMLEKLYDPLLHLLRNAFDHGIEPSDQRVAKGKPAEGTIELEAYHRGNQTIVEIRDDGGGINLEKVGRRAVELGWITPDDLGNIRQEKLLGFLFESGFSTAAKVTEISGRGVGLDVVKSQLRELKGLVEVSSVPQAGTTFTLRLPLTLTIAKLLSFVVNSTLMALPSDSIEEIFIPQSDRLRQVAGNTFLAWREQLVPLYPVANLVRYGCPLTDFSTLKLIGAVPTPSDWLSPVLIVRRSGQTFALQVDRLLTEQELVIKPFGAAIASPNYVYGCTILSDGRLVPVIDAALLVDQLTQHSPDTSGLNLAGRGKPSEVQPEIAVETILVVDDSAALRRTLALTLQKAGYRVVQARDGVEALKQLENTPINLVICDVEMPNMNGFEFLSQRRRDDRFNQIPVFMLTSRSNDKHRRLALQLGANQYFSKPYIESELLSAIRTSLEALVLV